MAQFTSRKFDKSSIKDGERYAKFDIPTAAQFNAIVEGVMYATEKSEEGGGGDVSSEQFGALEARVKTLEDKMSELTYEDIAIKSFAATANGKSTIEMPYGSYDQMVASITWTINRIPTQLTLTSYNGSTEELALTASGSISRDIYAPSTPSSYTWKLLAKGENGETSTRTASINFYNGVYYGKVVAGDINASVFGGLTKELRNSHKSSFSVTAGVGEYICYCIPVRLGTCKFRINGFTGGFLAPQTISFTNAYGYTEDYYFYRSSNANLGETTVEVING